MPRYFSKFPKLSYNGSLATDILTRISTLRGNIDSNAIFYTYDIQEGDTPELIASKYYGDPELHWVVLIFNDMYDPFYDWPMTYQQFVNYIDDKYGSQAAALSQVHHYEKIITSTDGSSGQMTTTNYIVDQNTYINVASSSTTSTFPNGSSVTIDVSKQTIDCYTYEQGLNESKRQIKLIKSNLVNDVRKQFEFLMGA